MTKKKLSPTTLPCDTACSKKPSIPNIPQQITVTKSQPTSHNQPKELPKPGYPSLLSPLLCVGSCKARLIHRRHILPHWRGGRVSNETVGGGYQLGDIRRISFKGMGYRYLEKNRGGTHFFEATGLLVLGVKLLEINSELVFQVVYDGSSKVLFPLLALNRNSMRDAFCFTCKKIILKIQVKCSKSISLEKSGSFPAKRASAQICLIIRLFVQKI